MRALEEHCMLLGISPEFFCGRRGTLGKSSCVSPAHVMLAPRRNARVSHACAGVLTSPHLWNCVLWQARFFERHVTQLKPGPAWVLELGSVAGALS